MLARPRQIAEIARLIGGIGLIVFLLVAVIAATDVAGALRAFPAPTEHWASIITGLAWPLAVLTVIIRFGADLSSASASIARRIRDGEDLETPWIKLKGAVPVDPGDTTRRDVRRLLNSRLTQAAATKWMKDNLPAGTDLLDFETSPTYMSQRQAMIAAVLA